jgi:hypothetical protein
VLDNGVLDHFRDESLDQLVFFSVAFGIEFADLAMIKVERGTPLSVVAQADHSRLLVDHLNISSVPLYHTLKLLLLG